MNVILVDERDKEIGVMAKMEAHEKGALHRAFSIFIFNDKNEMLIHQRAKGKYHNGGLWTNACCSHPLPGESVIDAANRRLKDEMGFNTKLEHIFEFTYTAQFENGLTENEFDHVFIGNHSGAIYPDPEEVSDYSYVAISQIRKMVEKEPNVFTVWFKLALPRVEEFMLNRN